MHQCLNCKTNFEPGRNTLGKYCNNLCQANYQYKQYIIRWKQGTEKGYKGKTVSISNHIRKYMLEKYDYACVKCGWNNRHPVDNLPLVEIDHKDGNAKNCKESNLAVLCPNCHAMTPTFRARNKKSERNRKPLKHLGDAIPL